MLVQLLLKTILVPLLICQALDSANGFTQQQTDANNFTWTNAVKACKFAGKLLCPSSKLCPNDTVDPTLVTVLQENNQILIPAGDGEDQWVSINHGGLGCSPFHISRTEFGNKTAVICSGDGNLTSCSDQRNIFCCDSPKLSSPKKSKYDPCQDANPCEHGWCRQTEEEDIGYKCICGNGFQWDQKEKKCIDIDECDDSLKFCQNRKRCYNIVGTYICQCRRGYYLNQTSNACVDLNECETGTDQCLINADCENVEGHYRCTCKNGFIGDGYIKCHLISAAAKDFKIECNANKMKLTVPDWLIKLYGQMHLHDPACVGISRGANWIYIIRQDLSSCGTRIKKNKTHIVYKNVLTNSHFLSSEGKIHTGTPVVIDWSCSYLSENIPVSLQSGLSPGNATGIPHFGKVDADGYYENIYGRHPSIEFDTKYDADVEAFYYSNKLPAGFNEKKPATPILTEDVPGSPILAPVTLKNGTVVIPGLNTSLPEDILEKIQVEESNNGIEVHRLNPQVLQLPNATGKYELSFWPFTDNTYKKIRLRRVFDSQEMMHLRVLVDTGDRNIAVVIDKCWGTPDQDPASTNSILLVSDGCASDTAVRGTVKIVSNGQWRTADFRVQVFTFKGYNTTYIHCRVDLCNKKTNDSCKPNCEKNINRRRKRSVDEITNKITLTTVSTGKLTLGPFYIRVNPKDIEDPVSISDNEDRKTAFVTPAVIFIVIAAAILIIAFVIILVLVKRSANKNTKRTRGQIEATATNGATEMLPML